VNKEREKKQKLFPLLRTSLFLHQIVTSYNTQIKPQNLLHHLLPHRHPKRNAISESSIYFIPLLE
jgi:hypothetical protein